MVWASVLAVGTASLAILRSERMLARLQRQSEQAEAAAAAARLLAATSPGRHAGTAVAGGPRGSCDSQPSDGTLARPSLSHWAAPQPIPTSAAGAAAVAAATTVTGPAEPLSPSAGVLCERAESASARLLPAQALPPHPAAVAAAAAAAAGPVPASTQPTPQMRQLPGQGATEGAAVPAGASTAGQGCPRPSSATRRSLRYPSFRKPSAHAVGAWTKVSWSTLLAATAALALHASVPACRRAGKRSGLAVGHCESWLPLRAAPFSDH